LKIWRRHQQVSHNIQQQARNPIPIIDTTTYYQEVFLTKAAIHTMGGKKAPKQEELTLSK
jgi:hypothetical protein